MASKKELAEDIKKIAAELERTDIVTDGLNHADLTSLLSDLKNKKADAESITQADNKPDGSTDETQGLNPGTGDSGDEEEAEKLPEYTMAEGKALTTRRGICAEGDEIKAEYLPGGLEAIKAFVKSGHIVHNK